MFILTSGLLVTGFLLEKRFKIRHTHFLVFTGSILASYNIALIIPNIRNIGSLLSVFTLFIMAGGCLYIIIRMLGKRLQYMNRPENYLVALAHLFDASTTFYGVDFLGNIEQHVVPNLFIGLTGTSFVMYPLKIIVLIPALYYIDKDMADDDFGRKFLKFVVAILGLGPGTRNMTLMILG